MSAGQRMAWRGGTKKYRDHFPVLDRPFFTDGESIVAFMAPHLARDWQPAIIVTDEGDPYDIEMADGRGDGYVFPLGFNAKEFGRYAFIARQWHLALEGTIAKSVLVGEGDDAHYEWTFGTVSVEFDYSFSKQASNHFMPAKESDLLSADGFRFVTFLIRNDESYASNDRGAGDHPDSPFPRIENIVASITPGIIPPGDTQAFFFSFRQDIVFFDDEPFQVTDIRGSGYGGWIENKWWPRIQLEVGMSGDFYATTAWLGREDVHSESKGSFAFEDSELTIKGVPLGDPEAGALGLSALSLTITPKKFWPYANSAGEQVYDEDSGDELVDPFS